MDDQRPVDIPSGLEHLIQLNVAYRVLICPHNEYYKAVRPRAFNHRQRYWVVDESERGDTDVGIREGEESVSRLGLRDDEGVVDTNTDAENDEVEEIGAVEPRDEEVTRVVINKVVEIAVDEGIEVVINNNVSEEVVDDEEEVFSAFDDSGDEDYRESSEDAEDSKGSSEVGVDRSNNEEDKESSGEADDDEEEGSSEVEVERGDDGSSGVADDDEEEVVRVVNWRARERKI
ncbi:hypothetical protein BGZ57DRAFT_862437 [Hyaloscypha finlandica]|nr:hypothetical protein BGZ57DRAFT_862437 [Hyaloscypha finlandica]